MTTSPPEFGPSKGAVDRAGVALRAWWNGWEKEKGDPLPEDPTDLLFGLAFIRDFDRARDAARPYFTRE